MKLILKNNRGFFEEKTYEFDGKDIVIEVEHNELPKFNLVADIKTEKGFKHLGVIDNKFIIPANLVESGEIKLNICVYLRAEKCRLIPCDTLIVKKLSTDIVLVPEIEDLKGKIADYEKFLRKYKEINEKLIKLVSELNNIKIDLGGAK